MTAVILPEFILKALEAEISEICLSTVKYVCEEYSLPYEEVKEKVGTRMNIELATESNDHYRIITRKPRKKEISLENTCIANMFDKETRCVRRCTKEVKDGTQFCRSHLRMSNVGRLRFGTADES
jgi:hypothetical protein